AANRACAHDRARGRARQRISALGDPGPASFNDANPLCCLCRRTTMSPTACLRCVALCAALSCLAGLLPCPTATAADHQDDVDLTLVSQGREMTNSVGMKLKLLAAGKFIMGAPKEEPTSQDIERPQHEVQFTKAIYFGIHEVTQKQYTAVVGTNP